MEYKTINLKFIPQLHTELVKHHPLEKGKNYVTSDIMQLRLVILFQVKEVNVGMAQTTFKTFIYKISKKHKFIP